MGHRGVLPANCPGLLRQQLTLTNLGTNVLLYLERMDFFTAGVVWIALDTALPQETTT